MARVDNLLLVGSAGTNTVMTAELSRLSRRALSRVPPRPAKSTQGVIVFPWDAELARIGLRYHRTATRVLAELYRVEAMRLEPLYELLRADVAADDRPWLAEGSRISVRARSVAEFEAGDRQLVGTVKNAIIDAAAGRGISLEVDPHHPDIHITVRVIGGAVSVSIDLAGQSLSQRGYRTEAGEAPLREHLAAVLLMLSRWNSRDELLYDPMCGSGTIAIEAALMASARPRGTDDVRVHSSPLLASSTIPDGPLFADAVPAVVGSEIDEDVLEMAERNADAAGVRELVAFRAGDLFDVQLRDVLDAAGGMQRGLILSNPPYGERLDSRDLASFYRELGRWCGQFRGFRAGFLVGDVERESNQNSSDVSFVDCFGYRPRVVKPLANGPIRAHFYLYEL